MGKFVNIEPVMKTPLGMRARFFFTIISKASTIFTCILSVVLCARSFAAASAAAATAVDSVKRISYFFDIFQLGYIGHSSQSSECSPNTSCSISVSPQCNASQNSIWPLKQNHTFHETIRTIEKIHLGTAFVLEKEEEEKNIYNTNRHYFHCDPPYTYSTSTICTILHLLHVAKGKNF